MGKITKPMQQKHKDTLSPWLKSYVETTSTVSLPHLPKELASFPSRWPFGRGDLYHWIPLLNRFDSILEHVCATYKLNEGPQTRDFGCDVLLNQDKESTFGSEKQWSAKELTDLGFSSDGDRQLVEAVLRFTRMLLEHCGNRSIYASSAHLSDLLNTTSLSVLIVTLEVGSELAQRYQASIKRIAQPSRQISAALLANHYNIDLDRVQQLALPFVKTPIISLSDSVPSNTPGTSKGKDRAQGVNHKTANSMHANDLVALAASDDKRWTGWGDVKVVYYPQNDQNAQQEPAGGEGGRASVPSTPTPLRRSSTMTTQHQTPKSRSNLDDSSPLGPRTPGTLDESASAGSKVFELPQSVVSSAPIYRLMSSAPTDLPPASKYEVFHKIRVSKALMGSSESRQQLLTVRLLAINNLAYIHPEATFVEKVLRQDSDETRRFQLVYQLAELIHPTAHGNVDVPLWLQAVALALLEAISNFPARCQDVLSALNANVNHGILLYVIRKAVAGMKEDDDSDKGNQVTEIDEWRNNLFSLTLHLAMSTRVGSEMVSAGLMDILIEILNIRSAVAQRNHSMVLAFLDGLIWSYQNAFTAFFNAKGLDAVSQLVVDAVQEAQTLHQAGQGIPKGQQSGQVDYEIPYYQQQTLKWLLKFVHHIMSNSYSYGGNFDRLLRNLVDKSDFLGKLRDIIEDKQTFGSVIWTNAVTILSDFINNDPTNFPAISESGMIKTYLEAITNRPLPSEVLAEQKPSDRDGDNEPGSPVTTMHELAVNDTRPHPPTEQALRESPRGGPLAAGILPSTDAIAVVPQVLSAISLNNAGMNLVAASRAFEGFLEIFESPAHVRCMELDGDLANNVGSSFDELARHHPALRSAIANAVIDMVARVRFLGIEKAREDGWGARLLLVDGGKTVSLDEDGNVKQKTQTQEATGDADVSMPDAASASAPGHDSRNEENASNQSITPYLYALGYFLSSYISNQGLKTSFVEAGGLELLLDICESPSLPTTFGDTVASRILGQVVCQLVESFPIRGLPSLLRRAQSAIDTLKPLSDKTDALPPYFAPFLLADLEGQEASEAIKNGTKMIKALLNAQTFIKLISDCFSTTRSNTLSLYPVNVYDYYLKLVNSIGPLLRGVLTEEAGELNIVPQHWSFKRQASEGSPIATGDPDMGDSALLPDMLSGTASEFQPKSDETKPSRPTEEEQASPRYQNCETLRHLLHPMIPTTFPLFQTLGKSLLPRRERDPRDLYQRPRHLELAKALANAVLDQLRPSVAIAEPTSKDFHFWIIMLHTISEMVIDQPNPRPSDRSAVQIILPVLLAFKEEGGMDVLSSMLRIFAEAVRKGPDAATDEAPKSKVAAFGLKKVLELVLVLVNGKSLSDAQNAFGLQPRSADRSPQMYQQLVVEFRAAVLPGITRLWDSDFVEKVPHQTVTRLIDILKLIGAAEHESVSSRDKPAFRLFNYADARFDWRPCQVTINGLLAKGYDADLVHEAVFRANGNASSAEIYCAAHQAGLAGARNPIPAPDSDTSVLEASGTNESETARAGASESEAHAGASESETANVETDRMSLDVPDLADRLLGEALGEIIDHPPQNADGIREPPSVRTETPATAVDSHIKDSEPPVATKEDVDKYRAELRANLIDRCLDVVRAHPETAIEVSELIRTMVLKQQSPNDTDDEIGQTLTLALSSLAQSEEEDKQRNGKCIAAYAHLLALLLQDERFFVNSIESLGDHIDEYIGFLKVPPSSEEMPPWIPYILLVIETLLRHDERPIAAQWKAPKSLEEAVSEPIIETQPPIVVEQDRARLLEFVLEMLPRIGKEETLAIASLRILVILTRSRHFAKLVGDKKNLQRLFLMAKQLSGSGSERFKQSKLTAHIMTVLRHIVEDEETIKQIMRAEIKIAFPALQRTTRGHPDVQAYLRTMSPIALRAPDLFVEVSHEMLRFTRWASPSNDNSRTQSLELKEEPTESGADKTNNDMQKEAEHDIKQSTEPADKEMVDAPKPHESKRPVVENPDGVIHFLLCELLNYREVDDKEVPVAEKDSNPDPVSSSEDPSLSSKDSNAADAKDKKPAKPVFKSEEHPIFIYRCFLLNCLAELLQSYNRTKMEFINFKRNAPLTTSTPIKPRSSVLNYLIYDLLCQGNLSGTSDSIAGKKKAATSAQTQKVLVALVSKTSEKAIDRGKDKFAYDDEPDLLFARKFVLDTMLKAYERAPFSDDPLETRYSRMQCLAELMSHMIGEKDRDQGAPGRGADNVLARSHAQLRRLMYEKGYLEKLTSSVAEINLNYPNVKRAIKYILRVLRVLTETAKELSHSNILSSDSLSDTAEDDLGSTSSLSDLDDREETPDLYRNSALGMLEPRGEDDESDDDEGDDDDEDMYGDEYDDEMEYGDDDISDEDDNISDEDEELGGMGPIEGLHGDSGVVEVIMDEDDDDDDSDEEIDDDDEVESADMEDVEDQVEIVDEDGNPLDDGNSDWESASHDDDDEDEDQEEDEMEFEGHVHHEHMPGDILDGMARAMMGEGEVYDPEMMEGLEDHYLDDGHDEDEDEDDEEPEDDEYLYDDEYPLDDQPQPIPALGWDDLGGDDERRQMFMLENQNRRRLIASRSIDRHLPNFMVGSREMQGDFRNFFARNHQNRPQNSADDGTNPLLRRGDQNRDGPPRPGPHQSFGLRVPDAIFGPGGRNPDGPMGFLSEIMEFLPIMGRNGQHAFHLQITGPGGHRESREIGPPIRTSRMDQRRDFNQDPNQAVSFVIEGTMDRYQEEARMIFGANNVAEAAKLLNIVVASLTPAAMELERKLKAEEAEQQKREEEELKKREEEERLAREAREAEEKAQREKQEAEAREAAERAASEAAAVSQAAPAEVQGDGGAMEGVESTEPSHADRSDPSTQGAGDGPRVTTIIRGEEVDVTELGIDPDYIAALPEEFREEVIAQAITARRSEAREETNGNNTEAFQEFLDALPEDLRMEIAQQERQEQRRRAREENNRQASATAGQAAVPEMDTASILLTFPPELRQQVLLDQGEELMDQLTPEMAAQARQLAQQNVHSVITGRSPPVVNPARQPGPPMPSDGAKAQRRTVVQMLDKAGIATLLRLMFITQTKTIREHLFNVFADVCENKQTRLEVISTLLQILQDGSTDMGAVERSFGHLSLKARRPKEKSQESEQKTPQTLKRSLTGLATGNTTQTNSETSPLLIVQQCLDLLVELSAKNPHVQWLFLTEHEAVGSNLKRSLSRKGKGKDSKSHKYAINSLLSLLDRDLVMESSVVMTHLADLLNRVTLPLQNLERRRKEAEDELKALDAKPEEEPATTEDPAGQASATEQTKASNTGKSSTAVQEEGKENVAADDSAKKQAKKDAIQKKLRQLQPPVVPAQNLTLAVRIFVARECSSKTFQNTISTIKNLSAIPEAKATFGQELVHQARLLSENIVTDLDDLLPHIEKASSGTEIQGVALAKFSPGASEQNKLLRVLTALDHLFDTKKKSDEAESNKDKDERHDLVTSLYHNSTFSAMWEKLSACLSAIRQRENMLSVATILLPLIESLMVVCKNTTTNDDPSQQKEMVLSSPPPESRTASLFFSFTEDHRRILNELVRSNPKLMSGTFALLVKNPKVLEFDNKRNYFNRSVHSRSGNQSRPSYPALQLSVRREQVFLDSFKHLYFKSGDEMKFGKLNIRFHGEEGVDAGGVTREWFQVLSRQMFDANYALFTPVSSDRTTFHPNKLSGINDEHLLFFKFIGRIIGKALYEGRVLDCYFSRAVYKRILGKSVSVKDMESFDPDYYKSLCWMLDNDITDIITETFSVEDDEFGVTTVVDLIPNGREIAVTEENKHDYVRLVVEHKLLSSVKEQMSHFLQGFHDIIPAELISIFNEQELELLISGLPDIDIDDWKSNTEYHNYTPSSQQIQWFWRALRSFDKEERAKMLQFVTGTSKVPLNGFKDLEGMNGVNRFNIHRDYGNKDRLPSSHTCFNQLDLPEYESYDHLRSQIMKAITAGSEYFGFA
ncbi:E3 ubiquitin-protein ligase tom1 [Fusarium irregulare]|uniref:HECT-type E3 ubiquitin transferase n=1 Tax=Fusarium irregulare TaxID=2494466 RepID=A0A9W8PU40_9HYPO|nr:E3 ubiquitin-protein ligase tom1 [Fusarium irregulare]KAJ4023267.1 E3 ubiquitin-protein ligase tom1 [Fusarium irregulare]